MARQTGTIRFTGSIGNITGYRDKDGNERIRQRSNLDKERLHNDEAFEATRTAWPYMGMASKAGAAIRHAFAPMTKQFSDHRLGPTLVGICQHALRLHHPHCPPDAYDYLEAADELEGMSFTRGRSVFNYADDICIGQPDHHRGTLQITTGKWLLDSHNLLGKGITHLRWTATVAVLPAQTAAHERNLSIHSAWMPVQQQNEWQCALPFAEILPNGTHAIVALALESSQQVGGDYYPLQSVRAMNIVRVIGKPVQNELSISND